MLKVSLIRLRVVKLLLFMVSVSEGTAKPGVV